FNQLNEDYEVHNCPLEADGSLYLMGERMNFGYEYGNKRVNIFDIRNSAEGRVFIVGAGVIENGKIITTKLLYEVPGDSIPEFFEKGNLFNVFDKWSEDKLIRTDGTKINSYIIAEASLDDMGILYMDGYWLTAIDFAGAKIEAKVINGQRRFVRFIQDKENKPILDKEGKDLVVDLELDIRRQLLEKTGILQEKKLRLSRDCYAQAEKLFAEGKYREAIKLFRKVIFLNAQPQLVQKAHEHIRFCRKAMGYQSLQERQEESQTLFDRAKRLFGEGDYQAALQIFKRIAGRKALPEIIKEARAYVRLCRERLGEVLPFSLGGYYNEPKPVDTNEERKLIDLISAGNRQEASKTRHLFVESYIWLVKELAQAYIYPQSEDYHDLIQEGIVELYKILNDYGRNQMELSFEDYARSRLREHFDSWRKQRNALYFRQVSLQKPFQDDPENGTLEDVIPDTSSDPEEETIGVIMSEELRAALDKLPDRERFIVEEVYLKEYPLEEIANKFGYSGIRDVQEVLENALAKLKKFLGDDRKESIELTVRTAFSEFLKDRQLKWIECLIEAAQSEYGRVELRKIYNAEPLTVMQVLEAKRAEGLRSLILDSMADIKLPRLRTTSPKTQKLIHYSVTGRNKPGDARVQLDSRGYATDLYSINGVKVVNFVSYLLRDREVIREATQFDEFRRGVIYWMIDDEGNKVFPLVSYVLFDKVLLSGILFGIPMDLRDFNIDDIPRTTDLATAQLIYYLATGKSEPGDISAGINSNGNL
ncbi:MAG: sigma-70 family RNA polymerase sigma factor, partial [Candidatus Omnitrophota bacterium]